MPLLPKYKMFLTTVFVVVLFILTQFSGPIVYNLALAAYQVLLVRLFGAPAQWLAAHTGFNTYDAFFWAKLVYTLLIAAAMVAALWFYSRNKQEFLLSLWLIGGALGAVVLANIASKVLKSYWLQTFSRDMLEVLTSPFPVLFLIPVLILYRSTAQGPK